MRKRLTGVLVTAVLLTAGCNAAVKPQAAVTPTDEPSATSPSTSSTPSPTATASPRRQKPPTPSPSTSPVHRPKPPAPRPHRTSPKPRTPDLPSGATAICRDGTFSFSAHRRGTCSHHGGVARWL